ncbi:phosphatase PAP2 family protein [Niveispirillum sp. KHB5.9]|uniref:phosphatase PAP2 family protein n=1 Tax=Niveispirillum sp. KHB5.9 TaxID=3400269 RepID=UPI003A83ED8E
MRTRHPILLTAGIGVPLLTLGAILADPVIAASPTQELWVTVALGHLVHWLDLLTGKKLSLSGPVIVLAALAINIWRKQARFRGPMIYVGLTQLLSAAIADLSKPLFERKRPFQTEVDIWFAGPDFGSFPSGHTAFYFGLFVPLAMLFPRWTPALLVIPVLVGAERILSHDHYATDVAASILLVLIMAWVLRPIARR